MSSKWHFLLFYKDAFSSSLIPSLFTSYKAHVASSSISLAGSIQIKLVLPKMESFWLFWAGLPAGPHHITITNQNSSLLCLCLTLWSKRSLTFVNQFFCSFLAASFSWNFHLKTSSFLQQRRKSWEPHQSNHLCIQTNDFKTSGQLLIRECHNDQIIRAWSISLLSFVTHKKENPLLSFMEVPSHEDPSNNGWALLCQLVYHWKLDPKYTLRLSRLQ